MPWVRFTGNFNWVDPRLPAVTKAFKRGSSLLVTTACAKAAIAAGKAEPAKKTAKP